jgi:hypothetical protein
MPSSFLILDITATLISACLCSVLRCELLWVKAIQTTPLVLEKGVLCHYFSNVIAPRHAARKSLMEY